MDEQEFNWERPGDNLTSEQIDEIGAAKHFYSYPAIVSIRRRIRENYSSREGVHYAGAEEDAAKLLDIVDSLYAQRERAKGAIEQHIGECDKRLEQWRELLNEQSDDPYDRRDMNEHQEFRDGLARALKHMTDTPLETF